MKIILAYILHHKLIHFFFQVSTYRIIVSIISKEFISEI